jgi:hypothetical protein
VLQRDVWFQAQHVIGEHGQLGTPSRQPLHRCEQLVGSTGVPARVKFDTEITVTWAIGIN